MSSSASLHSPVLRDTSSSALPGKSGTIPPLVLGGIQDKYGQKDYRLFGDARDGDYDPEMDPPDAAPFAFGGGVKDTSKD